METVQRHWSLSAIPGRIFTAWMKKASGASTNAFASTSGLSSTMAMSISPLFDEASFPACICSRIATALFSHRFRSTPLWLVALAIQFVVGPFGALGYLAPEECTLRQCGSWHGYNAMTARRMSLSSPHRRDVFCVIADSEFATVVVRRNLALVPYIVCSTLCCETIGVLCDWSRPGLSSGRIPANCQAPVRLSLDGRIWQFDALWEPLCKGEATCHSSWLYSFMHRRYVEGYYKSSLLTHDALYLLQKESVCLTLRLVTIFY